MAMRRIIADLSTRFSVQGLANVRRQILGLGRSISTTLARATVRAPLAGLTAGAKAASRALRTTAATAGKLAAITSGIGSIGGVLGSAVAVRKAAETSNEFIEQQRKLAVVLDMPIDKLSEFAAASAQYGVELDDIRQAFTQFFGVAGQARAGNNQYYTFFKSLGIDMMDARFQAMSLTELLEVFSKKVATLQGSTRTGVLSTIFGDDDAGKTPLLLEAIARGSLGIKENLSAGPGETIISAPGLKRANKELTEYDRRLARIRAAGGIVTSADAKLQQAYKSQLEELGSVFKGLQLTIFRAFGRPLIGAMKLAVMWVTKYRHVIANGLLKSFQRLVQLGADVANVFFGAQTGDVRNSWLYKVKAGAEEGIKVLKAFWAAALEVGQVLDGLLEKKSGRGFMDWLKQINAENIEAVLARSKVLLRDFWAVVTGKDYNIQTELGRKLAEARDTLFAFVQSVWDFSIPILDSIRSAVTEVFAGFQSGEIDLAATSFQNFGAMVRYSLDWVMELGKQLYNIMVLQQDATGRFEWLNTARDWITEMWRELQIAWGWFTALFQAVEGFLAQFGIDLKATLLFVGLLSLTGVGGLLSLVVGAIGLVGAALKGLFVLFTSPAAMTAFIANLTSILAFGAAAGPWVLGIAGFGLAVLAFYKILEASPIDAWFQSITDGMAGVAAAQGRAKAAFDLGYEKSGKFFDPSNAAYGKGPGMNGTPGGAIRQAAAPVASYPSGPLDYVTAGRGQRNLTINIPSAGVSLPVLANPSDIDKAFASMKASPLGAR